jgi:site-specific DNA-methyltransferase (adenine-specific)
MPTFFMMPEQLLGRIIRACSNRGEVVLDPFAGSGTTLAVAKKLQRHYLGFELSAAYADAVQARLDGIRPGQALDGNSEPLVGGKGRGSRSAGLR